MPRSQHLSTQEAPKHQYPSAGVKAELRTFVSNLLSFLSDPSFQCLCSEGSAQQAPGQPWLRDQLGGAPWTPRCMWSLSATPERRAGSGTFFLRCLWRASFRCQDPNLKLECSSAEFSESCRRRTKPKAPQRWAAERLLKPGHLHCPALQPELIKHTHCKRGSEQRPRLAFRQEESAQSSR